MNRAALKPWPGLLFAVVVTAATLIVRLALDDALDSHSTLVIFTLPIMVSAYLGGLRAGLAATAASYLMSAYWLLPPLHSLAIASVVDRWQLFFVALAGIVISVLNEALHRARQSAVLAMQEHRQAAHALRTAAALQSAIFDSANFCSIATDAKGVIQIFNVGAEHLLGYSAADVEHKLTPADLADPQEMAARALAMSEEFGIPITPGLQTLTYKAGLGMAYVYEPTLIRKDGSRVQALVSVAALRDPQGEVTGYLLIATDNTARRQLEVERQRGEAAVRDSEQKLRKVIDGLGPNTFLGLMTTEGAVIEANRPALTAAGIQPEDVLGKPFDQTYWWAYSATERERLRAAIARAANGEACRYEVQVQVAGGALVWVDFSLNPVCDASGRVTYLVPSGNVIDARVRADEALRQASALQNAIFNSANFSSIATDARGVIQIFNVGAERMLGYGAADVMNRITPAEMSDPQELIARAAALSVEFDTPIAPGFEALVFKASRGIVDIYELTYVRQDGTRFPAVVSVTPLRDAAQAIIGYLLIGTDNSARWQADEAQRETDALLRTIHLHSIVSVTDRAGRIVEVNDSFCEISGYRRDELLGQTHRVVNSGVQDRAFWTDMWRSISAGRPWRGEICNRTKAGSLYWVDSIIVPFVGADGRATKYVSIRTDVTAARLAAASMAASEALLERVGRIAGVGGWEYEVQTQTMTWTAQNYRLHDLAPTRAPTLEEDLSFFPAGAREMKRAALAAALAEGKLWDLELPLVTAAGRARWVRTVGSVEVLDGRTVRIFGVLQDITERKRGDARLRRLVDSNAQGVMFWSREGRIAQANDAFLRIVGYSREEFEAGQIGWASLTPPEFAEVDRRGLEEIARHGVCMPVEKAYIRKDGSLVPVMVGAASFEDSPDEGVCFVIDITERKQVEASLREAIHRAEEASRAKSDFLANTSHEIRTPMNAVIGLSYLLGQTALDEPQRQLLAKVDLASKSLLGVLNNVLDLSKIEAHELIVDHAPFSLAHLLRDLGDIMAMHAQAKGIAFAIDAQDGLPDALEGDVTRLGQVLTNLLSNAIKFTDRGHVGLRVRRLDAAPPRVRLGFEVEDTGIGIAAEVQARLFAPFVQADASITRRFGGTGLGLSIVKHLVTLMNGEVGLHSQPGAGSTFTVTLDFGCAAAEALTRLQVEPPAVGHGSLAGVRVLVVDDSDINLEVTQRILQLEGASVGLAAGGEDALDLLRRHPAGFDIVLMDVQMPGLDGHDATRRIRGELGLADLPVIALTAGALSSERLKASDAGMDDYIVKPFEAPSLVRSILRHLRPGEPGAALRQAEATPSAQWEEIEGIDGDDARQRFGSDFVLFRSMLKRLLSEFADVTMAAPQDLSALALAVRGARMHKLRGIAGMLGAKAIQRDAGSAEEACAARDGERALQLAARLDVQLQRLGEQAAGTLATAAAEALAQARQSGGGPLEADALHELVALLRSQSLSAVQRFRGVAPQLRRQMGAARFEQLQQQIDNLQFDAAADVLSQGQALPA
jgi:PAS domain S-box-containing protein